MVGTAPALKDRLEARVRERGRPLEMKKGEWVWEPLGVGKTSGETAGEGESDMGEVIELERDMTGELEGEKEWVERA